LDEISQFVVANGYGVIILWVLFDQIGVPIPAIPVLLTAGALSGAGQLDLGGVILAAAVGCIPSDLLWFEAGRRRGGAVLRVLCKLSLEPDSCVRSTENTFARHGLRSLLVAKLIPGYQTLSPALAGMSGISRARFLSFDIPGALLWSTVFVVPGYLLRDQIDRAFELVSDLGVGLLSLFVSIVLSYVAWKYWHRQRFLKSLRVARMTPEELKDKLDRGEDITIIDLRNAIAIDYQPARIPGAQVMAVEDLEARHGEIPRDQDVVLYCT
jgi:membrane protein DedA with SNARE-associated domain